MSTVAKIFIVVNVCLSFVYVFMAASLLAQKNDYQAKYWQEIQKLENILNTKKDEIVIKNKEIKDALEELRLKVHTVDEKNALIEVTASRLRILKEHEDKVKGKIPNLEKSKEELDGQIKTKEENNRELREHKQDLQSELDNIQAEQQEAVEARDELAENLRTTYSKVAEYSEQLTVSKEELSKVNDKFLHSQVGLDELRFLGGSKKIQARVKAVAPEANQIMIDAGTNKEVNARDKFIIYRGNSYIAQIEIEQVFEEMSIGRIVFGTRVDGMNIQEGDQASTSLR